ncbi:MAG: TraL conjugative transposon family protein [Paludibacter sp.]|nr:TraL conjugative transposon family protein [Paludibacter sp.]
MIKKIYQIKPWVEKNLQSYCNGLSPRKRFVSIMILCGIFGVTSLYMTLSALYNINKTNGVQLKIEHIKQLPLHTNDTINQQKYKLYERK